MTVHASFYANQQYEPADVMQRDADWISPGVMTSADLQVTAQSPAAMVVNVAGSAASVAGGNVWLPQGYRFNNDTQLALVIAAADQTNPRIDIVVAAVNTNTSPYTPVVQVVTGTAAATPAAPSMPAGYVGIVLAQVYVGAAVTTISQANITDERSLASLAGDGSALTGITAAQVGAVPATDVGVTVASLVSGQVPASQLGNATVGAATTTTLGTVEISAAPTSGNPVAVTTVDPYYTQWRAAGVTNFLATNTNSGADIALTWDNPTSNDFTGRSLFASTTDISNATYAYCVANATLISSGIGTGSGAADDYVYGVTIGTTYYFKIFALYDSFGSTIESAGVFTSLLAQNTTPPGNVTADTATAGNGQVTIAWTDPTDSTWAGTLLVRKVGSYPVDQNDGTAVVNSTVRNQYATTGFVDTGLTNTTQYYYQLFPYNTNGYYNTNSANQLTATPENYYIYGVSWNDSTGVVTRIDDAVGLTAPTSFDTLAPWSGMRRCNLSTARAVIAYYGNAGYSDTTANVMVEIPAFYYKMTAITNGYTFEIAVVPTGVSPPAGFTLHPAFYRDLTGSGTATAVSYRYHSAYEGYINGSVLESVSGVTPTVSQDLDTFRTDAQAVGHGWGVTDFNLLFAVQLLYLVEYASFDSQTLLGQGYTASANTAPIATGATASLGNASTAGTSATAAMSYRGIENWYGNIYTWIDGYVTSGTSGSTPITIMIGNAAFNDTGSGYTTSYTSTSNWTNGSGYISGIFGVPTLGFTPNAFAGSSTTGLYDYGILDSGYVPIFGGGWADGATAGAFFLYVGNSAAGVYSDVGARLAC